MWPHERTENPTSQPFRGSRRAIGLFDLGHLVPALGFFVHFDEANSAGFPPLELATLRIGMAGLAMIPLWLWHMKREHWRLLPWFAVVGLVGNGIPALLFATAQTGIDSGAAGVLNALTPMFTLVVGWAFLEKYPKEPVVGIVPGPCGGCPAHSLPASYSKRLESQPGIVACFGDFFTAYR